MHGGQHERIAIIKDVEGRKNRKDLGTSVVILWFCMVHEFGDFYKGNKECLRTVCHIITQCFFI